MWYGVSSIAARFINYLLTPYLTYKFSTTDYGEMSVLYAFLPFIPANCRMILMSTMGGKRTLP